MKLESDYGSVELSENEERLFIAVRELFESKDDFTEGSNFRFVFMKNIMKDYCTSCGRPEPCYCMSDG